MSPHSRARSSLLPADDLPSTEPQHTPGARAAPDALQRAMDSATLRLIEGAAAAPVQIAHLAASVEGLRQELTVRDARLEAALGKQQEALGRLVLLSERRLELDQQAQALAAEEARARRAQAEESARWWRSLVTPQGVLYLLAVLVTIAGAMLGVGHLIPPPKVAP